jgi:O-antigen/teichoic acid export membrane protein
LGIVLKQTFKNSVYAYLGLAIGYLNTIIFYPAYFSISEFGLITLITSISFIYSQLSTLGIVNTIIRYFPVFKTENLFHRGFGSWIVLIMSVGFVIVTVLYLIFKPLIYAMFIDNSAMFLDYYYWIIPLSLFMLLFNTFESFARAIHKTVMSVFLRDVLFRLLNTAGIFLFAFGLLTFEQFVIFYVLIHCIIFIALYLQIILSNRYKFPFSFKLINTKELKEIIYYGLYTLLSFSSYYIALNIDRIMLGSMIGLDIVGTYQLYIYIATAIVFPYRALNRIATPIIADHWKHKKINDIRIFYNRTSIMLMIISAILYIGIIVNENNLVKIINKPEFIGNFNIFILIGFSFVLDATGGINSDILSTSDKFRIDVLYNVIFLVLNIILNFIFIPLFGGIGAAVATTISIITYNILKWYFIKKTYKMQPFNSKYLIVLVIAGAALLIGLYLPEIDNVIIDILYRSIIVAGFYFGLILLLKLSVDINEKFFKILRRFGLAR